VEWSFSARLIRNADCGSRIAECRVRNPQFEVRNLAASLVVRLLAPIFCFVLIAAASAQTPDQQQSTELKLPLVRCKIVPSMDTVRWNTTPTMPGAPGTEKDNSTQKAESQISYSGGRLPILNANFSDAKGTRFTTADDAGSPNANLSDIASGVSDDDAKSERQPLVRPVLRPVLRSFSVGGSFSVGAGFSEGGTRNVEPTTSTPQQSVEAKPATVRCNFAPTKDAARYSITPRTLSAPGTPATLLTPITLTTPVSEQKLAPKVDSQTPGPGTQPPTPNAELSDAERQPVRHSLGDVGTPNANLSDIASAKSERETSTDTWFQIPTESQETIDIQEAVVTTSANESNKVAPEPLAQVLADLARRAQRNFVDPGIPAYETIAYSFTDSDLDPWEAFTRIAQTRGYRIVYRDDIVSLVRGQEDLLSPANPQMVKAEVWVWLDQTSKPGVDRSGLFIQATGANVAPNSKPQAVRLLAPGSNAQISLFDVHSERGDSTLRLTVNPVALPNGLIQADLGIENAAPSSNGHKGVTIRRAINRTVELTPTKQVIQIDGILVPTNSPVADKPSWIQRWFRKKAPDPETATARMVVKLTVDPVSGSDSPIRTGNPVRGQKSQPGKTSIALAPSQKPRTPELIVIQNLKH
jgi:hypothetical protein